MVNTERIVPVQKIDLLSLVGTMLTIANVSFGVVASDDVEGNFSITGSGAAGNKLLNQPAKTIDFKTGVTGATVYFIADYGFEGFAVAGTAKTPVSGAVIADGITIQKAVLSSGDITVTAVTPSLA